MYPHLLEARRAAVVCTIEGGGPLHQALQAELRGSRNGACNSYCRLINQAERFIVLWGDQLKG